jgi:hypothetical protein
MPTIVRIGPYRFGFYSRENNEPPHIHVMRDRYRAKYWLDPVELADNVRFPLHELTTIRGIVQAHRERFLKAWNDHLGQANS